MTGPGAANVELVPTPTYASYLNHIECHFWAIQELVVKNAGYGSWDALALAVAPHQLLQRPQRNGRLAELERRRRVA